MASKITRERCETRAKSKLKPKILKSATHQNLLLTVHYHYTTNVVFSVLSIDNWLRNRLVLKQSVCLYRYVILVKRVGCVNRTPFKADACVLPGGSILLRLENDFCYLLTSTSRHVVLYLLLGLEWSHSLFCTCEIKKLISYHLCSCNRNFLYSLTNRQQIVFKYCASPWLIDWFKLIYQHHHVVRI